MLTDGPSTIITWEQLLLGGGRVRFHSETTATANYYWECVDEECEDCFEFSKEMEAQC
jgi:hypothetical protein